MKWRTVTDLTSTSSEVRKVKSPIYVDTSSMRAVSKKLSFEPSTNNYVSRTAYATDKTH